MSTDFKQYMKKAAADFGIELSDRQIVLFDRYFEMLVEWNKVMNLTAITEPREVAIKHMIDSLSAWNKEKLGDVKTVIDVGTGAGFPGIPLKIYISDLQLTLLDSLNKRIKFLQAVVDELGLTDVKCIHARAEEGARNKQLREKFDVAISRAVARLPVLAEYCVPFVKPGGTFIALKGMKYAEEADEGRNALKILGVDTVDIAEVHLPELDDKRAVIYAKKNRVTPRQYPRKAGTPDKNPL